MSKCKLCGQESLDGYVWDGKDFFCSKECVAKAFDNDPDLVDMMIGEGRVKRFVHKRPQDDIPYEQRMKHIIEGYRYLMKQNEKIAYYTKSLELKVGDLERTINAKSAKNVEISNKFVEKNRECKRLKAHVKWLESKLDSFYEPKFTKSDE